MMYQFNLGEHHVHRSLFHSLRMQASFALLFAVALPLGLLMLFNGSEVWKALTTQTSLAIASLAAGITLVGLRRVSGYFGAVVSRWILPIYGTAFAILVAGLVFLRIPYSSVLLGISFLSSLISFYVLSALMIRGRQATCYLVPIGRAAEADPDWNLRTIYLTYPRVPADPNGIMIADLHAELGPSWERVLTEAALMGRPVYHYTQLREAMTGKVQFEHFSENSFGALVPALAYQKIKRAIDIVASLLALPILLPVMAVIALVIKVDSPGPALFRQRRVGYRSHFFDIIKFRTMTVTENGEDPKVSITREGDLRITRVGHFLRRTRLDELPQVFNILKGDMSWIGPRPEAVALSMDYSKGIPYYRYRHLVRPGITGWAQVHQGHVTDIQDIEDKLSYDFYYVKNISFWIDMVIALRTIRVLVTGFGAK
ncbi:exopolysaccharide biosynthesis polyprenyl glycosylphosphotransferase [Altererythrobacter sp. GH1-8]|uniref:exopolysaccharide biosynthesis polyprenyl glycosylphosphotransferase n=1 Tax=Altererythrobacter sp. GH1-8 TaxID=3349333 RepID=UPI00374D170B